MSQIDPHIIYIGKWVHTQYSNRIIRCVVRNDNNSNNNNDNKQGSRRRTLKINFQRNRFGFSLDLTWTRRIATI